eukprot:TRINITY_DN64872_c0_g1_i1.p1 TRINITY_DN64872_c0_g1~~TRINITY_DN64872_c0_g1_i1.p1  ORF type:complete len:495 (-),score=145.71 TRINITY_DN64872_c0_g1_i1:13-1497(-)
MELATALIWTLRIVLPIILFCLYFKFQSSKDEQAYVSHTSSKHKYSRSRLLEIRKACGGAPVPETLANLTFKDQIQAPSLFQGDGKASRSGGKGGGKRSRENREDRNSRGDREKRDPGDKADREARRQKRQESAPDLTPVVKADEEIVASTPAAEGAAELVASQEKMHLESLLNYVAFNRKDQQRNFMLDEDGAPPPPPPKPAARSGELTGDRSKTEALDLSHTTAEKANAEAQMVLRGAINFKRADVAKDIYEQLAAANVDIFESTFTLMIEAAVLAKDLKSSSDFLMKMETSGHSPASELLDKVLDLYSAQKTVKEQEKQQQQKQDMLDTNDRAEGLWEDGPRAKLKADAPIFVPSFGIPPPPPKKKPQETDEGVNAEKDSESATQAELPQRTKLKSAANVFVPQFADPNVHFRSEWSMGQGMNALEESKGYGEEVWEDEREEGHGGKAGSKGRGGKPGKNGKGKQKDAEQSSVAKQEQGKKVWKVKEAVPA